MVNTRLTFCLVAESIGQNGAILPDDQPVRSSDIISENTALSFSQTESLKIHNFTPSLSGGDWSIILPVDLFLMSSCIATRWLVHNGGYIQKLKSLGRGAR